MKLCRYGKSGFEKPGVIDAQGQLRDLSHILSNIDQTTLSPAGLAKLKKIKPETLPMVKGEPRLGVPYTGISKFVAIGLNYSDHAKEAGMPIPTEPVVFMKATTCICGPNDDIIQPRNSTKLDWEVELAIVIGTRAQYVSEEKALNYVAGYCIVNDVSERAFQMASSQWDKGKSNDSFGPHRAVAGDHRRNIQSANAGDVARCQRPAYADWQHAHDDFRLCKNRLALFKLHDIAAGGHHYHRHAAGRGPGHEAHAPISQTRRHRDAGYPGSW